MEGILEFLGDLGILEFDAEILHVSGQILGEISDDNGANVGLSCLIRHFRILEDGEVGTQFVHLITTHHHTELVRRLVVKQLQQFNLLANLNKYFLKISKSISSVRTVIFITPYGATKVS